MEEVWRAVYEELGDSPRVAAGFERIFKKIYERMCIFYSCEKRAKKSDDELKSHQ